MARIAAALPDVWVARRAYACRLSPDRWLETFEDAQAFLAERQMLSITPSTSLPSVFGACRPNPDPLARGYASWPSDKWWWPGALSDQPGVQRTRLLSGGRVLLISTPLLAQLLPLFQYELQRADNGDHGPAAQELVHFLDAQGPSVLGDARKALRVSPREMAQVRDTLEQRGAVLSEDIELPAKNGGHIHTSRLFRADQVSSQMNTADPALTHADQLPSPVSAASAHRALLRSAVRAAVIAERKEIERWFVWNPEQALENLLAEGAIRRVGRDHLAASALDTGV